MHAKQLFLRAVLGPEATEALQKAISVYAQAEEVLTARAVLSWLELCPENSTLPGLPDSCFRLEKKENGSFHGFVDVNGFEQRFENQPLSVAAAHVSLALGMSPAEDIDNIPLAKLGKAVDLLVKARILNSLRKKLLDTDSGYKFSHEVHTGHLPGITVYAHDPQGAKIGYARLNHKEGALEPMGVYVEDEHQRKGIASAMYGMAEKYTGKKIKPAPVQTPEGAALWQGNSQQHQFGKSEARRDGMGSHAKPAGHIEPVPQLAPGSQQKPKLPKSPKPPVVVLTNNLQKSCKCCGQSNLDADVFVGCLCFRVLASEVKIRKSDNTTQMFFGASWDKETLATFLEGLES